MVALEVLGNGVHVLRYTDSDAALAYAAARGLEVDWTGQVATAGRHEGRTVYSAPVLGSPWVRAYNAGSTNARCYCARCWRDQDAAAFETVEHMPPAEHVCCEACGSALG